MSLTIDLSKEFEVALASPAARMFFVHAMTCSATWW